MPYRIAVQPGQHSFSAEADESILESALAAGIMLPYGCRNGACGACKGRVIEGEIEQGEHQASALSEAERNAGHALLCCARARSDLRIQCREVRAVGDIPLKTLPCRVQKMQLLAPDVMALHLKLPANERLQFLAGQYIEFLLKDGRRRAFSLANAPHDDELLQVHVRRVAGGRFTEHVFTAMRERDILRFEGPHGSFHLREASTQPIVFVAGGTGFAPIKSVIEHALHHDCRRPMVLYWGARRRADLYMDELARSWARSHAQLRYVPVLSEPQAADAWQGRTGLVHRAVMQDYPSLARCQVYACGAPAMIEAAQHDFTQHCELGDGEFFADAFSFAADPVSTA